MAKSKQRPKREHSRLTKAGLKFIFKHKLFSILISTLVLITGAAYTLLVSANDSFKSSYDHIVKDGMLHQYVIKENFKPNATSAFEVKGVIDASNPHDDATNIYDIKDEAQVKSHAIINSDRKTGTVNIRATGRTGDYVGPNPELFEKTISFNNRDDGDFTLEINQIKEAVKNFESDLTYAVEKGLTDKFVKNLREIYKDKIYINNNRSISIASEKKAFNVVAYNRETKVNKMFVYDGTDKFTQPLTNGQMVSELRTRLREQDLDPSDYTFSSLKGYSVSARDATGQAVTLTDPSSYQAIISPAYANRNGKRSLNTVELNKLLQDPKFIENISNKSEIKYDALRQKYERNLLWIDSTPYFIIGIGTTPDYVYPIIDQEHPVLDVANQAVVYVNKRGYERIYDGFRTNPKEEYISLRFAAGVSPQWQNHIISEIETLAHDGELIRKDLAGNPLKDSSNVVLPKVEGPKTGYPANIRMVTSYDDRNDQLLLTQERVVFLHDIEKTIQSITIATTSLLIAFLISIVSLVFQMVISIDRKRLSTQLALGYPKWRIALSRSLISLFVAGIPTIIGYLAGYGGQFWFIQHFDNYWTIPTFGTSFSPLAFIITVALPFVLIGTIIFAITLWVLRRPITEMLSPSGSGAGSEILAKIVSKFKILGVKGRYVTALTAKNVFKLFLLTVASIISITSLTIGISSIGKADQAYNATVAMNKYEFEVDLYSPTREGGYYGTKAYESLGAMYHGATYDATGQPNAAVDSDGNTLDINKPHWHIPSTGDATYGMATTASHDLAGSANYLKHKVQVMALLDQKVSGMNPWDMAKRLMPDNQRNKAKDNNVAIINILNEANSNNQNISKYEALVRSMKRDNENKRHIPYAISYGDVIVDKGDETYTYINANIKDDYYKIVGVKENTQMVSIQNDMPKLKNYKGSGVPILINKYIEEKLSLKIGSTLKMNVNNDFDRNLKTFSGNEIDVHVVGIVDGYDNKGLFTLQTKANEALHMNPINGVQGFNGVFTKEKEPAILSTMPLYSPSGLWLGTDTIVGQWENVLGNIMQDNNIWDAAHQAVAANPTEFFRKYSRTPFVGATNNVLWNEISKYTFKNVSELSSFIISMIEAIAITVSIIFTAIIASLLLISNKKKIASLWTMGYRKKEIGLMFLSTYIIPALLTMAIAIPSAFVMLIGMKHFIMAFGNILIPFSLDWWSPIVAIVSVSAIFVGATFGAIVMQKQSKALEAFKED